ncbi:MAG: tRNA 2-thiouridine(34) synthase MnmA [Bdellovibrionales bacterium CG12_big_fil_rev_8_21_14_0_65_38_15]|nr:MAG: tRNA 2-thiouridine(34) synthase MnmA [Bdellovibrionales bacterium CG22_combo_CG10-13_8_21_14_all_38_13]PIQ55225.1 MAG: tRNA 2-thiouridine(34) synthase MnmA [Bdellovibrionales bacterium CG12_big_fil_rev_8_21_14_0_65_38_15]PIR30527.1 MAG: tRNA 2-thiouridine(34) synthase MnmA [Bdellovibrionales bacterium CG11_big_fil_rev_8_21_14_0_20_38_13]
MNQVWDLTSEQLAKNAEKTVIVGMSGGVDSSVSALILKKQGYKVIGLFMKNWEEEDENGVCQASKEYADVVKVCEKIDIPYYSVEFVKEYRDNVFLHFLKEYEQGHTPNPDILCNREIKFKVFYDKARELGADFLATGHYCQTDGQGNLIKGADQGKDQTYFLYAVKKAVLKNVLFPIGNLQKSDVRAIAVEFGLATATKKDSTGICFIGERNFKNFLSQYLPAMSGNFELLNGEVVGKHDGCAFYTPGQRKGLGLGGQGEPWFVVAKDVERNAVIVERGERHPAMYCDDLTATDIDWIDPEFKVVGELKLKAKVRYRQADQDCIVTQLEDGRLFVRFEIPQRAVTQRQSVVFYKDDQCLGGAMIEAAGTNYYERKEELPAIVGN